MALLLCNSRSMARLGHPVRWVEQVRADHLERPDRPERLDHHFPDHLDQTARLDRLDSLACSRLPVPHQPNPARLGYLAFLLRDRLARLARLALHFTRVIQAHPAHRDHQLLGLPESLGCLATKVKLPSCLTIEAFMGSPPSNLASVFFVTTSLPMLASLAGLSCRSMPNGSQRLNRARRALNPSYLTGHFMCRLNCADGAFTYQHDHVLA